ncbi:MAG: gliding motility lipoprotein GldH [Bacteroidales bacterium]|nr:gliding motility lipoprotein GldH [Bacteroidales bacterium]
MFTGSTVYRISFLLLLVFMLNSCIKKNVYQEHVSINQETWDAQQRLSFEIPVSDTLSINNLIVNVRNTQAYPFQNIFLFIETIDPRGVMLRDTLDCMLASQEGRWLGSGLGSHYQSEFIFKRNVRFPHSGIYTLVIEQGMRKEELPGISDVGVRVEKVR